VPYKDPEVGKARKKKYREDNRERLRAKDKTYAKRKKKENANWRLDGTMKYRYGITAEQYNQMMAAQGGVCVICAIAGTVKVEKRSLCVDHDHVTGRVRGLLCHRHNFLLGNAGDSLAELSAAYHYLNHYKQYERR